MFNKIYYGWWIVIVCFFINLYIGGIVFFGFTAFFEPIRQDLGWSYTQISFAASLRGLEMGILAPITGYHRLGAHFSRPHPIPFDVLCGLSTHCIWGRGMRYYSDYDGSSQLV